MKLVIAVLVALLFLGSPAAATHDPSDCQQAEALITMMKARYPQATFTKLDVKQSKVFIQAYNDSPPKSKLVGDTVYIGDHPTIPTNYVVFSHEGCIVGRFPGALPENVKSFLEGKPVYQTERS